MSLIYWVVGFCLLALIFLAIFIIINNRKYKYKVEIRELTKNRKLIIHDVARDYVGVDGGNFWKLKREKDWVKKFLSVPPDESIELDHRGCKCITLYRDETGSYQFLVDDTKSLGDEKMIQPLKTNHRITLIDNFKKAQNRGAGQFLKKYGLALGAGMIIVILFVAILAFWGDLAKPVIEINKEKSVQLEVLNKIVNKLEDLDSNVQTMQGRSGAVAQVD